MLMIGGVVASQADFDLAELAKKVYREIGYQDEIEVFVNLNPGSRPSEESDGGMAVVHGYATRETREMLPRPFVYAQNLVRRLDDLRLADPAFAWLRPDGKVQLMMEQDNLRVLTVLAAHAANISHKEVQAAILERVLEPSLDVKGAQLNINPTGPITVYGLQAESGGSGRKITADTYGGLIPFGDSTLSGKDPHQAARAGAYMTRLAARYLVKTGLATAAVVKAAYVPGRAEPAYLEAQGLGDKSRGAKLDLSAIVNKEFDFRPAAIVERLGLERPLYQAAAAYGHFGRSGFPWEE